MDKLAENQFQIAVDDYGVNASTQQRVEQLNPDIIKIDRSLMLSYMSQDRSPCCRVSNWLAGLVLNRRRGY